uniref:SMP-30/Gluconolactonase/LRE-like region domain-containing protein n=1 Tax=Compsopogon caeruleus TaxID=31354 RepID=A0A7S1THC1_9RHOD|mmetsp:Transcript_7428/g.15144  ORF Transcript_7428/g.15144 Transcript_7428/m.15144 type:complete len:350 (+) Transcript_7428:79-1128(+)
MENYDDMKGMHGLAIFLVVHLASVLASSSLQGTLVIANRGSGTLSVVDPITLANITEVTLPDHGMPMYVNSVPATGEVWVGDRNNSRMVIYKIDGTELVYDGYVPVEAGVFHSITTQVPKTRNPAVWVTCDTAKVTVVIDVLSRGRICTIPTPKRIRNSYGFPHDVTSNGRFGYVTYLNSSLNKGFVLAYDLQYRCHARAKYATAVDPHVGIWGRSRLVVAAQGGVVSVLQPGILTLRNRNRQPSPHGVTITRDGKLAYVTNIMNGGMMAVVVYQLPSGRLLECPMVMTSIGGPHNVDTSLDERRLFITHSMPSVNTAFEIGDDGCVEPNSEVQFFSGSVPFGLDVILP